MSRLRDLPHVWRSVGPLKFCYRIYLQAFEDNLLVWAAALAYSWLLALFPFLIFLLSLVPLVLPLVREEWVDRQTISNNIRDTIEQLFPTGEPIEIRRNEQPGESEDDKPTLPESTPNVVPRPTPDLQSEESGAIRGTASASVGEPSSALQGVAPPGVDQSGDGLVEPDELAESAEASPEDAPAPAPTTQPANTTSNALAAALSGVIENFLTNPQTDLLTIGLVVALFTASGGMSMTMAGLDKCYDVKDYRPFYINRPIAMLLTVIVAVMIVLVLILLPIGNQIMQRAGEWEIAGYKLEVIRDFVNPLRYFVAILLLFSILALIYKWGPSVKTRLRLISPGSVFVVAMWLLTGWGFRYYIENLGAASAYARTYGAVGGVAILMFLFYVDAFVLLLGAEINSEIDFIKLGIRSGIHDPTEEEVAHVPTNEMDEEDFELAEELQRRREESEGAPPPEVRERDPAPVPAPDIKQEDLDEENRPEAETTEEREQKPENR